MKRVLPVLVRMTSGFASLLALQLALVGPLAAQDRPEPRTKAILAAQQRRLAANREFFKQRAEGTLATPPAAPIPPPPTGKHEFANPLEARSADGKLEVTLEVAMSHNQIGKDKVYLRNYNGKLVGPTLRAQPGDTLLITLDNRLPPEPDGVINQFHAFNITNLHTHGLHVSPSGISDNVLREVLPGTVAKYEIKIPLDHPCGTFWYHAHHHGSVAAQVGSGMAGALIIEGGQDTVKPIAAAPERVIVLQQIPYYVPPASTTNPQPEGVIELEYQDKCFSSKSWTQILQHHTTINGQELPVFRMAPGSVERWRIIDTAVHEAISFRVMQVVDGVVSDALPMYEIARDGLSLGEVVKTDTLALFPGYRSDVLIQAPLTPGEYLLVDEATDDTSHTINGVKKSRNYIGRLLVDGTPKRMTLPAAKSLAKFRLPSIPDAELTGTQSVAYSLHVPTTGGATFLIDGKPFDPGQPRVLKVGNVEEWTLKSAAQTATGPDADVVPLTHPFHIHVNPFEVVSMIDDKGEEHIGQDNPPHWRDTIAMPAGWVIKVRSRYVHFTGEFVQHCHILPHEDLGMMQLIQIQGAGAASLPKGPAAAWNLPDTNGRMRTLAEFRGKPLVLVFSKGFKCAHCAEQVQAFSEKAELFKKEGAEVVFITSQTAASLQQAVSEIPLPFAMLADPEAKTFRDYGCFEEDAKHGTFVIDRDGHLCWQTISAAGPLLDVAPLLTALQRAQSPPQKTSVDRRK